LDARSYPFLSTVYQHFKTLFFDTAKPWYRETVKP